MGIKWQNEHKTTQRQANERQSGYSSKKLMISIVVLIVVILVAATGWFFISRHNDSTTGTQIDKDSYQAVFLTNGQVYFGHLQNAKGEYLSLSDIYYLQVQQSLQPGGTDTAAANATNETDASKVQLIKLGNELHAPKDHMQINVQQVLFWENIQNNGKVAQAIANYKQNPTK